VAEQRLSCFVIMPFSSELHYFYLYLQRHIEHTHDIDCERADNRFATGPFLDKIVAQIQRADVVIADCTGSNPNVLYELGIAHALNKKTILISQDPSAQYPSDIKHFEFVRYRLDDHEAFLSHLDLALREVLVDQYLRLYEEASTLFRQFKQASSMPVQQATKELFLQRIKQAARAGPLPSTDNHFGRALLWLPAIVANGVDQGILSEIRTWAANVAGSLSPPPAS
jgi:hypothetical protein